MELNVLNKKGKKLSKIKVDNSIFGLTPNKDAVHRAVLSEMANSRQGTHSTKSRGMVRGGGKKPWKQKGRGVARAGTNRSPIWRGGGTVFGPEPHKYEYNLPKKIKRLARKSVLSQKIKDKKLVVIDDFDIKEIKTKYICQFLQELKINGKILFLSSDIDENLFLSLRNIPNVALLKAISASTYDLLDCDFILIDKKGLELLNEGLAVK
ncbi:MAG: 50S ribosomal protein L4 [Candidatus Marinimicrobia bacterium]|nr:50S ribosomal protein L4 [Candidatus Neomarinimicrobiota bacterium]